MDTEEFKDVFLPLGRLMYVEAIKILHSQADAEDAVQDMFTKLWEHRESLELINNPRAYAITMVRNHCLNIFNSAIHRQTEEAEPENVIAAVLSTDPLYEIENRDCIGKVLEIIDALPENQRKIITLHDMEGRTNQEIEQITGLSSDNIRQLLSRARKAIRSHFFLICKS